MKDPAFLFYSSDFLNGVSDLTMEERGQFITLLCIQHQKGELTEKTIRLCVGSVSVDVLNKFRLLENGNYINERLATEIEKRSAWVGTRRENGKKGGRPKSQSVDNQIKEQQKHIIEKETEKKPYGLAKTNHMGNENVNVNEDENIDEIEVFDLKPNPKKSKSGKSKLEVLPKYHDEMIEVLEVWNKARGKSYRTYTGFQKNYEYWRNLYSFDEICQAIINTKVAKWWSTEDIDISVLFNKKKQNGSDADHIGSLLNVNREVVTQQQRQITNSALSYLEKVMNE